MSITIGIDVGGTNIKIGIFDDNKLIKKYSVKTNADTSSSVTKQIISELYNIRKEYNFIKVGLGIPGPVVNGVVLGAQNINWFEKVELKKILEEEFSGVNVEVYNDANAAALGEFRFGSGKEYNSIVFVTLGTGIGGGIILNNSLIEGATGSAGEIGHLCIESENKRSCTCGLSGCFEQYASATGITKTGEEIIGKRLECKEIFEMALNDDEKALKVIEKTIDYLTTGLALICNTVNPEAVIIGGGVSAGLEPYMERIKEEFNKKAFYSVRGTEIRLAVMQNDAGIYGVS